MIYQALYNGAGLERLFFTKQEWRASVQYVLEGSNPSPGVYIKISVVFSFPIPYTDFIHACNSIFDNFFIQRRKTSKEVDLKPIILLTPNYSPQLNILATRIAWIYWRKMFWYP